MKRKIELICLKDKCDPCFYKRCRKDGEPFYNCVKPYITSNPPCEWVICREGKCAS